MKIINLTAPLFDQPIYPDFEKLVVVEGPVGHDDTVVELVVRPPALRRALESIL
jgi:hypothetical protein